MEKPKNHADFELSLSRTEPPDSWTESLKAMWWDYQGNWTKSHDIAQEIEANTGHWIHAYLHRKEGDSWNAGYWYRMAGRPYPNISLAEEAKELVQFILEKESS